MYLPTFPYYWKSLNTESLSIVVFICEKLYMYRIEWTFWEWSVTKSTGSTNSTSWLFKYCCMILPSPLFIIYLKVKKNGNHGPKGGITMSTLCSFNSMLQSSSYYMSVLLPVQVKKHLSDMTNIRKSLYFQITFIFLKIDNIY